MGRKQSHFYTGQGDVGNSNDAQFWILSFFQGNAAGYFAADGITDVIWHVVYFDQTIPAKNQQIVIFPVSSRASSLSISSVSQYFKDIDIAGLFLCIDSPHQRIKDFERSDFHSLFWSWYMLKMSYISTIQEYFRIFVYNLTYLKC